MPENFLQVEQNNIQETDQFFLGSGTCSLDIGGYDGNKYKKIYGQTLPSELQWVFQLQGALDESPKAQGHTLFSGTILPLVSSIQKSGELKGFYEGENLNGSENPNYQEKPSVYLVATPYAALHHSSVNGPFDTYPQAKEFYRENKAVCKPCLLMVDLDQVVFEAESERQKAEERVNVKLDIIKKAGWIDDKGGIPIVGSIPISAVSVIYEKTTGKLERCPLESFNPEIIVPSMERVGFEEAESFYEDFIKNLDKNIY